jgi:ABC-type multidrug transport system fused ATPase/permease subunit
VFRLPPGIHRIIDRPLAVRLALMVVGSIVLGLGDMLGVAIVLPLMEVIIGGDYSPLLSTISRMLGDPPRDRLAITLALLMTASFILKSAFGLAFRWWMRAVTAEAEVRAATEMFTKVMSAPYWLHRSRSIPEVLRAVYESAGFAYGYVGLVLGILTELVTIGGLAVTLLLLMPVPTVAAAVYFGLATWLLYTATKRRVAELAERLLAVGLRINQTVLQSVNGFREMRLHGLARGAVATFQADKRTSAYYSRLIAFFSELPKYALDLVFFVGVAGLVAVVFSTSTPSQGLGMIAVFVAAASRILPSLVRLTASFSGLKASRPGVQVFLYEHLLMDKWERESLAPSTGHFDRGPIEFQDVHFAYPSTWIPVLKGIDVVIQPGQTVAVVGSSGAGKTTLVDILLGLLTPQAGQVVVAGKSIADDPVAWRRQVAAVPQDIFILDDTLERNVTMSDGSEPVDQARLQRAIERSQLEDVIAELADGLHTRVGERGSRLSGGQRQRLGIARALYREPDVLVLDEATSALDNETEYRVTETLRNLQGQMTIVVVAHRLSTVKHCDLLLFLSEGKVAASGTFAEVERTNEEFARLVQLGNLGDALG